MLLVVLKAVMMPFFTSAKEVALMHLFLLFDLSVNRITQKLWWNFVKEIWKGWTLEQEIIA